MFMKYMTNKKERDKIVTEKEFWEVRDNVIDLNDLAQSDWFILYAANELTASHLYGCLAFT